MIISIVAVIVGLVGYFVVTADVVGESNSGVSHRFGPKY